MSLIVNIAATFSGKKAFKDAQKQVNVLESSVKKLGATLGLSLSTAAVVQFGKATVKAFMEDEKSAAKLANTLNNLGLGFANPAITTYISELQKATGVVDDELRPALQALVQQTGSLTKSQELLNLAISISRGSGESLTTVTNDLAQAYVGNTRGLRKYYLGLTQAELKVASFEELQARLNKQFSGANAAYLATYAGQMQLLTTAAGEAQETIGKGLIDALLLLSEDSSVQDLATSMQSVADYTADAIVGVASLAKELKKLKDGIPDWLVKVVEYVTSKNPLTNNAATRGFGAIRRRGEKEQNSKLTNPSVQMFMTDMANYRLGKEKIKTDKKILKAQSDNTKELKKQALTKKQSALFDMEQIQIIAALKGKISEEDRLRLTLQLALITGNTDQAKKLSDQLADSIDSTGKLKQYINTLPEAPNPFKAWDEWLKTFKANLNSVVTSSPVITAPATNVPISAFPDPSASVPEINRERGNMYGSGNVGAQTVVVQIDGKAIASALQDQSMSAGQIAYLNRRTGGFD